MAHSCARRRTTLPGYNPRMDYAQFGFVRAAAAAPRVCVANPAANAAALLDTYRELAASGASLVVTPELGVTGYSCEDLFGAEDLLAASREAIAMVARETGDAVFVVGAPWRLPDGRLLNAGFVCARGRVVGAVPKSALPNHEEYYEKRWFASGRDVTVEVDDDLLGHFTMSARQLFDIGGPRFAVEICEDLWSPAPPSVDHALAGADIVVNLSASNELVAKADYRRDLVRMQSARLVCGYLYASSGPWESTKDVVYGGHLLAAENGWMLGESERFRLGGGSLAVDFDWHRMRRERGRNSTFSGAPRGDAYPVMPSGACRSLEETLRRYPKHPFVPDDEHEFDARARDVLAIQATGLARRLRAAGSNHPVIGLSGGLDSTLAFLVCLDALALNDLSVDSLHAITMPGPGTTEHTNASAKQLADAAGASIREISIEGAVHSHLDDIDHNGAYDVTFENVQARERTQILFDVANQAGGIVVGTGDLSELALGWCTFNADHMAHYNVNASVPKTMVAYLVRWYGRHRARPALAAVLERVLDTPITPELVPSESGDVAQRTESIIGPYELHDFFLYHYIRTGAAPDKIYALARLAFAEDYSGEEVKRWLEVFFRRFFGAQFKRTTLPAGPKVGTVALSPRGDWRMPDEADANAALASLERL